MLFNYPFHILLFCCGGAAEVNKGAEEQGVCSQTVKAGSWKHSLSSSHNCTSCP